MTTQAISNFTVEKYNSSYKNEWDSFVENANNSHFMFKRDFMEYHADRFDDHSLIIKEKDKIIALMPANKKGEQLISHQGLTFSGLICGENFKAQRGIEVFHEIVSYAKAQNISSLKYKAIPYCYFKYPCQEDLYALNLLGAKLINRDITSVVDLHKPIKFSKGKRGSIKKAKKENIELRELDDFTEFFVMVEEHLKLKYGTKPVHDKDEMRLLRSRFPENIKLFAAFKDDLLCAGIVTFETDTVCKTQYISSTELGRNCGAVDLITDFIINEYSMNSKRRYFDFGTSPDESEFGFNSSLIQQKELFGARAVMADTYLLEF